MFLPQKNLNVLANVYIFLTSPTALVLFWTAQRNTKQKTNEYKSTPVKSFGTLRIIIREDRAISVSRIEDRKTRGLL